MWQYCRMAKRRNKRKAQKDENISEAVIERNRGNCLRNILLGRFGSYNDLEGAAGFLASEASDFIVSGGWGAVG